MYSSFFRAGNQCAECEKQQQTTTTMYVTKIHIRADNKILRHYDKEDPLPYKDQFRSEFLCFIFLGGGGIFVRRKDASNILGKVIF